MVLQLPKKVSTFNQFSKESTLQIKLLCKVHPIFSNKLNFYQALHQFWCNVQQIFFIRSTPRVQVWNIKGGRAFEWYGGNILHFTKRTQNKNKIVWWRLLWQLLVFSFTLLIQISPIYNYPSLHLVQLSIKVINKCTLHWNYWLNYWHTCAK